jgi:hypothetical protein
MRPKCPKLSEVMIFADDARLAAYASCLFAEQGVYVPVVDGPRLQRPDHKSEVVRRTNAAKHFILAGLNNASFDALKLYLPTQRISRVDGYNDCDALRQLAKKRKRSTLVWGQDRIGIGVLAALRARSEIAFGDTPSPRAPSQALEDLARRLQDLVGVTLAIPRGGSVTFISNRIPYGFAFPEFPSTHLFRYPDLGIAIVHGFAKGQQGARGTQVAALVDPGTTPAPEITTAAKMLAHDGATVRVYRRPNADVSTISEMIELFPYDLMLIATHCGDIPGYRWTYRFTDSESLERTLVVDIALGIGRTNESELLHVTEFTRFVSLDGVAWDDPEKEKKLHIGTAMIDFLQRRENRKEFQPAKKEGIGRVVGSAALRMADHNLLAFPRALAGEDTPIIINNACTSWHRLAGYFMFAGARAYIGTLFPISTSEADEVTTRVFGKYRKMPLAHAYWAAQREVYQGAIRRPYVVAGVYPQRVEPARGDIPAHIARKLIRGRRIWQTFLAKSEPLEKSRQQTVKRHIQFIDDELKHVHRIHSGAR